MLQKFDKCVHLSCLTFLYIQVNNFLKPSKCLLTFKKIYLFNIVTKTRKKYCKLDRNCRFLQSASNNFHAAVNLRRL